jgi:cell division GTPase FtsZ
MARKQTLTDEMNESLNLVSTSPVIRAGVPLPPSAAPVTTPVSAIPNVAAFVNPATHVKAREELIVEDVFAYETAFRYAFVGSGQGGARMASSFWSHGYRRVALFNTVESDFNGLPNEIPRYVIKLGGAAKNARFAAQEIAKHEDAVWDLYQRAWGSDVDMAFVCVGLGGGTGSGTAETLLRVAKDYMGSKSKPVRVGVIASLPSVGEGQQVCRNALETLQTLLASKVSPIVLIDNARINQLYRPGMTKLYEIANTTVSSLFHLFNQLAAANSGLITFDQSELAQLLGNGICVMGATALQTVNSPADVSEAIRDQLTNNVLAEVDLRKGTTGACIFVGSQELMDNLNLEVFEGGFNQMNRLLREDGSIVHRGVYVGDAPGLQVYVMVSGLQPPAATIERLAKAANVQRAQLGVDVAKFLGVD